LSKLGLGGVTKLGAVEWRLREQELVTLAGPAGVIHVSTCDDANRCLKILVIVPAQTAVTMILPGRPLIRSELSLPSIPDFRCPTWRRVSRRRAVSYSFGMSARAFPSGRDRLGQEKESEKKRM